MQELTQEDKDTLKHMALIILADKIVNQELKEKVKNLRDKIES